VTGHDDRRRDKRRPGPDGGAFVSREQFTQLFRAVPSAVSIVAIAEESGVRTTTVSAFSLALH
jgi:hypothetical protein